MQRWWLWENISVGGNHYDPHNGKFGGAQITLVDGEKVARCNILAFVFFTILLDDFISFFKFATINVYQSALRYLI